MRNRATTWRGRALAMILALCADPARAVSVNPDGIGQVLLFPYYSAQTVDGVANATFITLSNASPTVKAVSVSFFEGKAGLQVLGFNLFLAPAQSWFAVVTQGPSGGAQIRTSSDNGGAACSAEGLSPPPPSGTIAPPPSRLVPDADVPFRPYAYSGDGIGNELARTLEGYFYVIEEGTYAANSQTGIAVIPVNGVATCAISNFSATSEVRDLAGRLMGHAEILNPLKGYAFAADPTALDSFRSIAKYDVPGSIKPDLRDLSPPVAVRTSAAQTVVASGFIQNVDAVSAVLMHESVLNQYIVDAASGGATEWVITFPTKRYYYNSNGTVNYLFQRDSVPTGGCDDVAIVVPGVSGALPPNPPALATQLCWSSNVVSLGNTNLLGSANLSGVTIPQAATDNWARLTFAQLGFLSNVHRLTAATATVITPGQTVLVKPGAAFFGLPAIGFAIRRANFGILASDPVSRSNRWAEIPHKFSDTVTVAP